MSIEVKVGQVWQDKDKRRNTRIEIIDVIENEAHDVLAVGLVVGTEEDREYKVDRLVKRWALVQDKTLKERLHEDLFTAEDEPTLDELRERLAEDAPKPIYTTREAWLQDGIKKLGRELFAKHDIELPEVRVSVGWPGGRGPKKNVIGQCFATKSAGDKVAQIFISPVIENANDVLICLAHELIHAVDDCQSGHKKNFVRIAKLIGFVPKWTVATVDTATLPLIGAVDLVARELGKYPHSALQKTERPQVQKTYMVKIVPSSECDECDPGYKLRMTQKWLEEAGAPLCPHGVEMVEG